MLHQTIDYSKEQDPGSLVSAAQKAILEIDGAVTILRALVKNPAAGRHFPRIIRHIIGLLDRIASAPTRVDLNGNKSVPVGV